MKVSISGKLRENISLLGKLYVKKFYFRKAVRESSFTFRKAIRKKVSLSGNYMKKVSFFGKLYVK
jgi:hypothetical protein